MKPGTLTLERRLRYRQYEGPPIEEGHFLVSIHRQSGRRMSGYRVLAATCAPMQDAAGVYFMQWRLRVLRWPLEEIPKRGRKVHALYWDRRRSTWRKR